MGVADRKLTFRWGRGLVVALLAAAFCFAAVEWLAPERHVGSGTVAAEVSVRVVPRLAPSAEAIRRRVMSNENLRSVAARLRSESAAAAAAVDAAVAPVDDTATFERWRRLLIVEIHPTDDPQRRRIRFIAPTSGLPAESAALVESVAVQYAEVLTADRWYGAIDRLRSAEAATDATFDKLLDLLRNNQTAGLRRSISQAPVIPVAPRNLPTIEAAPIVATPTEMERELFRLVQQRAVLLETLQPAHPQVVAIDARLTSLQLVGAGTHVRRMSGEEPLDLTLPGFDDAPTPTPTPAPPQSIRERSTREISTEVLPTAPAPTEALPPAAGDAVLQWQQSRTVVKACLDELLEPAAAEFPVVSTAVAGLQLWEHRAFWRMSAVTLGLLVGIAASLPRRGLANIAPVRPETTARSTLAPHYEPIATATSAVAEWKQTAVPHVTATEAAVFEATVPAAVVPSAAVEVPPPSVVRPVWVETLEQAAEVTGAPILGVLVRRREQAAGVA